jgi:hypothetical protein
VDDQYYVGDSGLLFKPVVVEGATSTEVYLADDQVSSFANWDKADVKAILRLLLFKDVPTLQIASICIDRNSPLLIPIVVARWQYHPYPSTSSTIVPSYVAGSIYIDHIAK